jgi:hypothetical protein
MTSNDINTRHLVGVRPLEWLEVRLVDTMFRDSKTAIRVWEAAVFGRCFATIIECDDGQFTLLSPKTGRFDSFGLAQETAQLEFNAAISLLLEPVSRKPVAHLVWQQGRRGIDDVEDFYEVARPGDKSIDGSDPFPVWDHPHPVANAGKIAEAEELVARLRSGLDNVDGGELGGLVTRMNEAANLIENMLAGRV